MLRNVEDFSVVFYRVALAGQWKVEQKKSWEDQGTADSWVPGTPDSSRPGPRLRQRSKCSQNLGQNSEE